MTTSCFCMDRLGKKIEGTDWVVDVDIPKDCEDIIGNGNGGVSTQSVGDGHGRSHTESVGKETTQQTAPGWYESEK